MRHRLEMLEALEDPTIEIPGWDDRLAPPLTARHPGDEEEDFDEEETDDDEDDDDDARSKRRLACGGIT